MLVFEIVKPFAIVKLFPTIKGLRIIYQPVISGDRNLMGTAFCDLEVQMSRVGQLWATTKTLIYSTEVLDYNSSIRANGERKFSRIKLFRDKPNESNSSPPPCWLQIIDVPQAKSLRKLMLNTRDLHCFELACQTTISLGVSELLAEQARPPQRRTAFSNS
ncbi:MAG: hypothetical protein ACI8UZ_001340 [Akkermansiaceae bacterium]|jgi:hypothetical protein